jgi:secretion/DNA translocation related TadE-like protein
MRGADCGYALIWGVALAAVLASVGGIGLSLCGLALTHARAGNAADLAAIAGAASPGDSCGEASRVATANAAQLLECVAGGGDVVVRVGVRAPQIIRWLGRDLLEITARAGLSSS